MLNMKSIGAKTALIVLALTLLVGGVMSGTLAWLVDKTVPVKNTFTYGDIDIDLDETTGDEYEMVPGRVISKDPKVSIVPGNEACWLFVKIEESANFDTFMDYVVADGWIKLTADAQGNPVTDLVYYREVKESAKTDILAPISVLKGDQVTVKSEIGKANFATLTGGNLPTLTFTAYAVQKEGVSSAESAWTLAQG